MRNKSWFLRFLSYFLPCLVSPWFLLFHTIWIWIAKAYELIANAFMPTYTPEMHTKKVQFVQKQVKDWNASGRQTKMCHARPAWRTMNKRKPIYKRTMTGIHIDMADINFVDFDRKVVSVEPLMTMGKLSSILIPMGWTIPIVPEFDDLTVGGLVCGAGLETSSHKYGLFQHICVSYEIVLASGEVIRCTKDTNPDLFYAIPWSCGTLGFLTSVEISIIPAKKYVKMEYIPVHSLDEATSIFESQTYRESGNEFVEGIMFSLQKGVIMVANMTDIAEPRKINSIGRWYKPWFYKHVQSFLNKTPAEEFIEYIPLRHYFHRHTKSLFWLSVTILPFGNSIPFRYLFALDFVVPIEKLKESLVLSHNETEVYPIWLCPAKVISSPGALNFGNQDKMYVDFGIYGIAVAEAEDYETEKSTRALETFCIQSQGFQGLYSEIFLTRDEFMEMFDHTLYSKVREELNCSEAFPDIYEKICLAARP